MQSGGKQGAGRWRRLSGPAGSHRDSRVRVGGSLGAATTVKWQLRAQAPEPLPGTAPCPSVPHRVQSRDSALGRKAALLSLLAEAWTGLEASIDFPRPLLREARGSAAGPSAAAVARSRVCASPSAAAARSNQPERLEHPRSLGALAPSPVKWVPISRAL